MPLAVLEQGEDKDMSRKIRNIKDGRAEIILQCDFCRREDDECEIYGIISRTGEPKGHICHECLRKARRTSLRKEGWEMWRRPGAELTEARLSRRVDMLEDRLVTLETKLDSLTRLMSGQMRADMPKAKGPFKDSDTYNRRSWVKAKGIYKDDTGTVTVTASPGWTGYTEDKEEDI